MENNVKKQRRPRKNFQRERTDLVLFCRISIGILNGLTDKDVDSFNAGQVAALRAVLKRLDEAEA